MHDSTCIKFRSRKNQSIVLEVKIVDGREGIINRRTYEGLFWGS